jgi:hypothetical protein
LTGIVDGQASSSISRRRFFSDRIGSETSS